MKLTSRAFAEAEALGVVIDVDDIARRLTEQDPPEVEGRRTVRLGRPSRARVVVDAGGDIAAVLPSSPRAQAGTPDVRGGDADRKRARDQERWERRQAARAAKPAAAPASTSQSGLGPAANGTPVIAPDAALPTAPKTTSLRVRELKLDEHADEALERLIARALARGERATAHTVIRQLILAAEGK